MFMSVCAFSVMDLIVKWSEHYPLGQVLFFRGFFGVIIYFFIMPRERIKNFYQTKRIGLHLLRCLFGLIALIAIFIAVVWLVYFRKLNLREAINKIFDKKILLSKSAKSDYLLFFINQIIMSVISPVLITQLAIATALFYYFHSVSWLDAGIWKNTPLVLIISAFTLFHFLLEDFSKYFVHRLMHKWPILWAIHKVHHSATFLTPMTVFRTHPLEGVVFSLRSAFTQAISISSFVFLFGPQVDIATILGANIFIFAFNIAGSNLRHSHIDISYWKWLEYLIISPAQHQVHHSVLKQHHDKNFGVALAVWDWLFGSLHHSEKIENLKLGIHINQKEDTHSLKSLYFEPLKEIFLIVIKPLTKLKQILKLIKFTLIGVNR